MQKIIQALLVSTLISGTLCQKIALDNSTLIPPCNTGARSAMDTYIINGNIGDNITLALNQKWQTYVYIKVLRITSPQLNTICQIYMGIGTCQPVPVSTTKCECFYNTTTDQIRFTVSDIVQADDSNAIMYVQWQHQTGTFIYSDKNYTFPEIYDVNAAQLNLTVAGVTGNLPSGSCSFSLTLNKSNNLDLCCSNTAMPCYPQIVFNGTVVTNNTETCVTYLTSQLASDGVTGNLVLSYSVCNLTDYRQGSNCTVTPKPDETTTESTSSSSNKTATDVTTTTTAFSRSSPNATDIAATTAESSRSSSSDTDERTTTTESPSSSSHTTGGIISNEESNVATVPHSSSSHVTESPAHSDDNKCNTICPAVIVPVVVVIIIGAAIAVYCYKTKKGSKAVSNGTNENADKAHTSEHHKKDRQNPEYTNQAYDGRESSPSEVTIHGVKTTANDNFQQHNPVQQKDSNKRINGRTNDGSASETVLRSPRQLPPLKITHTPGQLHPATAGSRPASVEITSTTAVKL